MFARSSLLPLVFRKTTLALSLYSALCVSTAAWAAPVHLSIAAGPLADAIAQLAAQSGVTVHFNSKELAGLRSAGLQGSYEADQGLHRLLQGSGFQLQAEGENRFSLVRA